MSNIRNFYIVLSCLNKIIIRFYKDNVSHVTMSVLGIITGLFFLLFSISKHKKHVCRLSVCCETIVFNWSFIWHLSLRLWSVATDTSCQTLMNKTSLLGTFKEKHKGSNYLTRMLKYMMFKTLTSGSVSVIQCCNDIGFLVQISSSLVLLLAVLCSRHINFSQ